MNLPAPLAELLAELEEVPAAQRLEFVVELGEELPPPPEAYLQKPDLLEAVPECQSPIFLATELEDDTVRLIFSAPAEAVTTRGLAAILYEGLNGRSVEEVLALPADLALRLPLEGIVSALRLNGLTGMLARIQRQVREKSAR